MSNRSERTQHHSVADINQYRLVKHRVRQFQIVNPQQGVSEHAGKHHADTKERKNKRRAGLCFFIFHRQQTQTEHDQYTEHRKCVEHQKWQQTFCNIIKFAV